MKPAKFEYLKPTSLTDALTMLQFHREDAAVLSGGQSLVPMLNLRVAAPRVVIDINAIPALDEIKIDGSVLEIGARSRHNDVLRSELVQLHAPLVSLALKNVAHEAIRNRGTLGGSLALADPAAEMPACMVCLDAEIVAQSASGSRSIAAADFFQGIYDTALQPEELITSIRIPLLGSDWRFSFHEIARRHGDFAMAGLALGVRCNKGAITECRAVFLGVEAFPRRLAEIEQALMGHELTDHGALENAVRLLSSNLDCLDGEECPADYRLHLAQQLLPLCAVEASGVNHE
jgi:aerobic carbon-monoxide dehydrogenase medium subunit